MIRLRNSRIFLLCALLGAAILPGCDGPTSGNPVVLHPGAEDAPLEAELQVWSWNIATKALQAVTPEFNQQHPGVHMAIAMTGPDLQSRLFLSLSAGVGAPDIVQLQANEAMRYAATGKLVDLTEVAGQYEADFPPAYWANGIYLDRLYAIPWDVGPAGVFYKRGLYERFGVDPQAIETWDDFINAGQQILERSDGKTKMFQLYTGELFSLFSLLFQQGGGQIFDTEGRIAINSLQARQALEIIQRVLDSGIAANTPPFGHEHLASLKNDSVACYVMGVWFGGTIKDTTQEYVGEAQDWGVYRLPALVPGGLRASNQGGSVLAITEQCVDKAAAWAFIEHALCTTQGQMAMYKNFDLYPAYLPALDDAYFEQPDPFFGNQKAAQLFSRDLMEIPPVNHTVDWSLAQNYLKQALSRWAATEMDNEAFLEEIERKLSQRTGRKISPLSLSMQQ